MIKYAKNIYARKAAFYETTLIITKRHSFRLYEYYAAFIRKSNHWNNWWHSSENANDNKNKVTRKIVASAIWIKYHVSAFFSFPMSILQNKIQNLCIFIITENNQNIVNIERRSNWKSDKFADYCYLYKVNIEFQSNVVFVIPARKEVSKNGPENELK